jgi:5-methyltetrahydropteroyltriglutamate--homocysteine methyltransferase
MAEGAMPADELRQLEDDLIRAAVSKQLAAGMDVVTDGEFRRSFFTGSADAALRGFQRSSETFTIYGPGGETADVPARPVAAERLQLASNPLADEAAFMAGLSSPAPFKVTLPAASMYCWYGVFTPGITDRVYRDPDELAHHIVRLLRELVAGAVARGARYVQFDFPLYSLWVNERHRERWRATGMEDDEVLDRMLRVDRAVVEGLAPEVQTALHVCRGNSGTRWLTAGSLDPIAERLFDLPYDRFLIEWDDKERDGGFESLRHVPPGPTIVLGIVSTKRPEIESEDALLREIDEAASYLEPNQLAISPQCGFGTVPAVSNATEDLQWRKLEQVARVADRVWPRDA